VPDRCPVDQRSKIVERGIDEISVQNWKHKNVVQRNAHF